MEFAPAADVDIRYLQILEAAQIGFGVTLLDVVAGALDVQPGALLKDARLAPAVRGRPKTTRGR